MTVSIHRPHNDIKAYFSRAKKGNAQAPVYTAIKTTLYCRKQTQFPFSMYLVVTMWGSNLSRSARRAETVQYSFEKDDINIYVRIIHM